VSFIGGFRPFDGGDDGLIYEGMARDIVRHLLAGNVVEALRGTESVFYFGGPGLRYLRAAERFVFGDTGLGYLSLILLFPFVYLALLRRFLSRKLALALTLVFIFIPLGVLFGTSLFHYSGWAGRGFADPAAAFFALGAVVLLTRRKDGPQATFGNACGAGLLMALAVFVRPNLAPFAGIMLAGAALAALHARDMRRVAGLCLGFLPVAVMPLHNWYFGGVFVLFSTNAGIPELLVMPPSAWLAALADILRLDFGSAQVAGAARQIVRWLSGPTESPAMVPLHAAAVAILVHVVLARRRFDPWLRLIAFAALMQHAASLIFLVVPRYHYFAWLMTLVVTAAWVESVGDPWLRQRWPALHKQGRRLALPVTAALARLDRLGAKGALR
jgi:hypothetical protein